MPDRLRRRVVLLISLSLLLLGPMLAAAPAQNAPRVLFETSAGRFVAELYPQQAPMTVKNFLRYVREGFYDGTIFHRVISGFVIQGGGYTADFERKPTHSPIKNEADNGLRNERGTLSMARTRDPDSATSQFFINLADNAALNRRSASAAGAGYAVFGKVVEGMDVIDEIAQTETGSAGPFPRDVPRPAIVILDVQVLQNGSAAEASQAR
ncbi:MAG: peptidyl-prolyl cis-trans isomerase [Nitrococcus mobilis]|nr:peptidyl-prolyl cis-trans isomerase [Nitrococcus mobilis]